MMPDVAEVRRFLLPTDRGIVTLQSSGVDVDEDHLIPGLTQAVAKAGCYQVWLSSIAQDLVKIRIIAYRVAPDVIVTTDLDSRTETARHAMDIIGAENDPNATRVRLVEYDGNEWYGVYFQYLGRIIDAEMTVSRTE